LKQQLEQLEKELSTALTVRHMTEKHPVVVALRKRIEDTKKRINQASAKSAPQSLARQDATTQGKTYYVDRNRAGASDSNPGTEDQPFLTVQRGVDLAQPGDTVLIKGSTDPGSPSAVYSVIGQNGITPKTPGSPGEPITIAAYSGHTVVLRGGGGQNGISLDNASYYTFRGLVFQNFNKAAEGFAPKNDILIEDCEFTHTHETGLRLRYVTNFTMRDSYVHNCFEAGISVRNSTNVTFERVESSYNDDGQGADGDADGFHSIACGTMTFVDCVARGNAEDGFDLNANATLVNCVSGPNNVCNVKLWRRTDDGYAEHTYTITNSVFYGGSEAGIKVSAGAALHLYNSVVYGNGDEGVAFRGIGITQGPAVVDSDVVNCIIANNGYGAIEVLQSGPNRNNVVADHNLYYANGRANVGLSADTNFIANQDPLFVDALGGNFHLLEGSPAIDHAISLAQVTLDFDGQSRPFGAAPDIGADEFWPGNRPPVANNDSFTVPQDSSANVLDVLANDSDPDPGDVLSIVGTTNPAHGTVAILGGATRLSYTPNAGYSGADTFTNTITDGPGETASATVAITVGLLVPVLSVSPASLDFGRAGTCLTLSIRNTGQGTLSYNISVSAGGSWLAASPVSGICTTETDTITVAVDRGSLPVGHYTATIAVDGGVGGTQNVAVSMDVALIAQRVLVEVGDDWRYLDGHFTPDPSWYAEWAAPGFDDSDWLAGPTGIGTGGGTNVVYATLLADMPGNYLTFYARKTFDVGNPAALQQVQLALAYDDGFVAYLNGLEVARANMGETNSPVWVFTPADGVHEAQQQPTEVFTIDPAMLLPGENVLAIEVHNVSLPDLDAGVIPRLTATVWDLPPVAHDDTFTVMENSVGNALDVLANDSDPDAGDVLTIVGNTAAAHGTAAILAGGKAMSYTPNPGYTGPDSFTYTVSDSCSATSTATVSLTVQLDTPRVVAVTLNGRADRGPSAIDPSGAGICAIAIRFNKPVTLETAAQGQAVGGLTTLSFGFAPPIVLQAVDFPNGVEQVIRPLTPQAISGSGTDVLTITFAMASVVDTWVKVKIAGDGSIHDAAGQAVDGEPRAGGSGCGYIFNASRDLPSGNGVPGGDAVFYVGSLRGDFNGDRSVGSADLAGFEAAWQAKSLDADFRGGGFGPSPPDGRVTTSDMDGFTAVYQAAGATGRHLDALPGLVP
jgi:uncharacterized protein (DUF3820 family)